MRPGSRRREWRTQRHCYVICSDGSRCRMLSQREVEQFRASVQRSIDKASNQQVRR